MKRLMMGMSLAIASLLFCGTATAQEEIEIEFDTEQIEQLAEELEGAAEQVRGLRRSADGTVLNQLEPVIVGRRLLRSE